MTGAHLHKVIYKPDTQSTEEYMIIVSPDDVSQLAFRDPSRPNLTLLGCSTRNGKTEVRVLSFIGFSKRTFDWFTADT